MNKVPLLLTVQALCGQLILLFLVFTNSCHGQVKTTLPNDRKKERKTITATQAKMIRTQGAVSGTVGCELQDKDGNLWFSAGGEGVYRYDGKTFTNFTTKDGLIDNEVSAIIEDKAGTVLFATENGICRYDGKSFTNYSEKNALGKMPVTCLFEDRNGHLWFGTKGNGIYRFDGKTLTNFLNNDDHPFNLGAHNQLILDIFQDKNGNLWFSSWNGGGVWRYNGKIFTNFLPAADYYKSNEDARSLSNSKSSSFPDYLPSTARPPSKDHIHDDMIFSVTGDKAGNLWFATRRHGVCRYDGKTFTGFGQTEGFVSYGVYDILEDKKGNLWLTTDKNGVFCYNGKTFKNYTVKDGLINDSVFSILEDKAGNLWFGTRGFGLSRYDGKRFTTFSEHESKP